MTKILMVVGSLRKASFNRIVAEKIQHLLEKQGDTVVFADIATLPLMNQDIEFPTPEAVQQLRRQVKNADRLWIVTPEYNQMVPGGLKNALDWLSRPVEPGVFGAPEFIEGKAVILTGAGGKKAARPGLANLRELLTFMGLRVDSKVVGLQIPTSAFMTGMFEPTPEQIAEITDQVKRIGD